MHRLKVDSPLLDCAEPVLPKEAARHLKVLRAEDGEEIELFDGAGSWRVYSVARSAGVLSLHAVSGVRALRPPAFDLTLFACVTKGSRWDWTIEKATELGVTRIVPVISDRTIVRLPREERAAKLERWRRIAEDAARQSDAKWLPEILEAVDFPAALDLVKRVKCFVGALVTPPAPPLAAAVAEARDARDLAVFIGPEGDFTPAELASLLEVAEPVSLGPTVLRAETAAIFALSVVMGLKHEKDV